MAPKKTPRPTLKKLPKKISTQIDALSASIPAAITDQPTYLQACEALALVQTTRKRITSHYAQIKGPLNATRKTVLAMERADLDRIAPAEAAIQTLITTYEDQAGAELGITQGQYRIETPRPVVEDLGALITAVHQGDVPREVLVPHLPTLTAMAKQQGGLFAVPGVRVETDLTIVTRR
mgnify:CR=1